MHLACGQNLAQLPARLKGAGSPRGARHPRVCGARGPGVGRALHLPSGDAAPLPGARGRGGGGSARGGGRRGGAALTGCGRSTRRGSSRWGWGWAERRRWAVPVWSAELLPRPWLSSCCCGAVFAHRAALLPPFAAPCREESVGTAIGPLRSLALPAGNWERRSGEETGPHGYWYRWTEVRGCDESGEVQVGWAWASCRKCNCGAALR